MSLKYERRLLDHLKHETYEAATLDRLAEDLGIPHDDRDAFRLAVEDLASQKKIGLDSGGRVRLPSMPDEVEGVFKKNPRGFGFIMTDVKYREGDVFVPPDCVGDALTGDRVVAAIRREVRRGGDREITGEILEVLTRKRSNFTGELVKRGGLWLVMPDGREMTTPISVKDPTVKNAKAGDKVSVEITEYARGNELAEGVIVKVLGEAGLPDVETQAVIVAYDLPQEFPRQCVEQARAANARFEEDVARHEREGYDKHVRLDLRDDYIITIDPPDAKDYDDAISISRTEDGGWELGVHIADVAHFIPPGTALDIEARERGNSVYLPRLVVPMLPEVLSNGICSLSEGVVRFCKSAFMKYGPEGKLLKSGVAATAIRSTKRLTYLEAQALIDGDLKEAVKHAKTEAKYTDQLIKTLREMDACAKAIRRRRRESGMIHLELPEVNLIFDDAGHVIDAEPEDNAFTHTLIEMFMVEANEVLARLFEGVKVPLLRRVHPEPTPGDVGDLRQMAKVAGFTIPKNPTRKELQALLDATAGTGAARAVHFAVLRTLTKAEYSPALIGHFALASEAYAHFTSPIRRYPDLTVHRALAAYLRLTDNGANPPRNDRDRERLGERLMDMGPEGGVIEQDELVEIGRHCTRMEENAAAAEQNLRQFLVLQLLSNHIGDSYPGTITGVVPRGVFVQIDKYLADGMIPSEQLPTGSHGVHGGRWSIDARTGALVHQSGRSFNIGDKVEVTIAQVDLALRKLDLVITDPKSRGAGKDKKLAGLLKLGGGDEAGGLGIARPRTDKEWHDFKFGRGGAKGRAQRSKSRDQGKADFRQDRKQKGK
ncbi:MAG: VacB/RNase II family 3'-5' exoribonuclease [Phycisphaeraceae bacterium]|nr:VacB/RNase II family 3'-5' exoribonuclease [Phycisphaeraceae bacterium]MBX3406876.1 VacB/RNase II family 3'-5' exoribonuclease [Phycisphaeraceae bacterium]